MNFPVMPIQAFLRPIIAIIISIIPAKKSDTAQINKSIEVVSIEGP